MDDHRDIQNLLLATLLPEDMKLLRPLLDAVTLKQKDVLFEPLQPMEHVYFFESGLSSEIAINAGSKQIEVGCVGREGFSGVPVVLGVDRTPHRSFMEAGGVALKMRSDDLQRVMDVSRPLRQLLLRYAHVFMMQIASTALADGRYNVEQRLARWLLMCNDRIGNELPLTHEFLALMLGVRRPSVTDALHILEGQRLIKAERSLISIKDRKGLEALAGEAYGLPEAEYRRLIAEI
ncbi:Crp/Fnr family transcriptional regulator [Rhizobium sp. BR 362]|uniref:Crp/Fnr family transcriptional regulator n=1 Tax=Rhizobium sp. BR 362 TaxID=3040670 RepID=UPI002F403BEE